MKRCSSQFPFPFPFPWKCVFHSHSHGNPMGIPFPQGIPFPCTPLLVSINVWLWDTLLQKHATISDTGLLSDDELAHTVMVHISSSLYWDQLSTVDWYTFASNITFVTTEFSNRPGKQLTIQVIDFLADRTATHYDRLFASSCHHQLLVPFGVTVLLNSCCFTCYFICTACACLRSQLMSSLCPSSVCPSVCDAVHCGSQGRCTGLNVSPACSHSRQVPMSLQTLLL